MTPTPPSADRRAAAAAVARDAMESAALSRSTTALLVRRPILAFVLNALIVLAGLAAFLGAEIRELPNVDRPVVTVSVNFSGASPETIDREVTGVIEGAAGRVPGVSSISSSSRAGNARITVEFRDGIDLDVAASDLRDAVARVQRQLPDDAEEPRVVKADADSEAIMRIAVTSSSRSPQELTQLVQDEIEDRLAAVEGVADLQIYGDRQPVFRVDIRMDQLASRGLSLANVRQLLAQSNFDAPAGSLSSDRQSLAVRATAPLTTGEQFEALEIVPGIRLGDVAQVSFGPDPAETYLRANGETGIGIGVLRQAQSNTLEISANVHALIEEFSEILPDDVRIFVTSDSADFINGAIHEVQIALGLSVLAVTAIIWVFLRDWRATVIPIIAIPVALIGTIAAIWLAGFSINILTLLALVLATGLVVDDAIVVLENVVRRRSEGLGPRAAAVIGTQQVFFAVVATTSTLIAVFVPLSFLPGQTGGLFREFGFTMAIAVLLSSITALTLCPVLASRMLRAHEEGGRGPVERLGDLLARLYGVTLRACLAAPLVVVTAFALFAAVAAAVFPAIRNELTPQEDRAAILLSVTAPQGVALDYTDAKMRQIETLIDPLRAAGEVVSVFSNIGMGGSDNRAFLVVTLADWSQRERSQTEIVDELNERLRDVIGVRAVVLQPNSLGIRGAGQGLTFSLVGSSYEELAAVAQQLVRRLEDDGRFGQVRVDYETTQPQLFLNIDRIRAADLGVEIAGLGEALQAVLDGRTVATLYLEDNSFDVKMVSTTDPVDDPGDLERIFLQSRSGEMIPVSSFVTLEERAIAPQLTREAQLRAVPVSASLSPDLSLGDAWVAAQAHAADLLPEGSRLLPRGEAATLEENASGILITFGMALLIVFLVLAAQFESFVSALIVMTTVPLGLACAVFAMLLTGVSLNVYSQIGLVLLVGIMAKNGILIVEFSNQLRDRGRTVRQAAYEGATIRLRPVAMTMVATVLGAVPLVLASGAGAEARVVLGWIIVGGLGLATVVTLYLTPVAFLLFAGLSRPRAAEEARLQSELTAAARRSAGGVTPAE